MWPVAVFVFVFVSLFSKMSTFKRKREAGPSHGGTKRGRYVKSGPLMRDGTYYSGSASFVPGRNRTGGYYGRYSGSKSSAEMKFFDVVVNGTATTVGQIQNAGSFVNIASGVGESGRIGRKITVKKVLLHLTIILPEVINQNTPKNADSVRIIVYNDKQCNGATATVPLMLETADYLSFKNLENSPRFNFLYDKQHVLNLGTLSENTNDLFSSCAEMAIKKIYMNCNIPVEYSGTTGVIAEIRSNNIGVMLIGLNGTLDVTGFCRIRYTDA